MLHLDDSHRCYLCHIHRSFARHGKKMTFGIQTYILFAHILLLYTQSNREQQVVTYKEILEFIPTMARELMGDLAILVFDLMGLRTSKDIARLVDEMEGVGLLPPPEGVERFDDYDVDLIQALRQPELKGSS